MKRLILAGAVVLALWRISEAQAPLPSPTNGGGGGGGSTIASGVANLGTSAILSGACAAVVSVTAAGVATTDAIAFTPNGDISSATGYAPLTSGALMIYPYPATGNVNFKVCNPTANSITPSGITLNWRVTR